MFLFRLSAMNLRTRILWELREAQAWQYILTSASWIISSCRNWAHIWCYSISKAKARECHEVRARQLPCKTTVWQHVGEANLLGDTHDFWLYICLFDQHVCKGVALSLMGEPCISLQSHADSCSAASNESRWSDRRTMSSNCSELRAQNSSVRQHWHYILAFDSFIGFLTHSGVSGPVPTMPSSLYSLLVVPTYADAAHLLCTGKRSQISLHKTWLVRAFFILWCLSLFFLIPRQMKMKKYSHWAAFLWSLIHTSSCRELQIFLGQKRI